MVNKVILIGNLGAKPEANFTKSGIPVTKFRIATTERFGKDESGNRKDHTEWHSIVAWRKLAEICGQYLDKGTKVYIEGRLRTTNWVGEDNIKRYRTEIVADNMEILTPKGMRESVPDSVDADSPGGYQQSSSGTSFPPPATQGSQSGAKTQNVDVNNDDDLDDTFL